MDKVTFLENLRLKVIQKCFKCQMRSTCTNIVFGSGNPDAKLMVIGEGPGEQEDIQGLPLVGPAGQKLDKALGKLGIDRAELYLTNIILCRTDGYNRTPVPEEWNNCRPRLDMQIRAIRPKVILALGSAPCRCLIHEEFRITRGRGTVHQYHGVPVVPTYHPSYFLHQEGHIRQSLKPGTSAYVEAVNKLKQSMEEFLADIKTAYDMAKTSEYTNQPESLDQRGNRVWV